MAEKAKKTEEVPCIVCQEKAIIFVSLVMGKTIEKVAYCQKHAQESGLFDKHGYAFIDPPQVEGAKSHEGAPLLSCETCGFTQSDFEKYGKFGCSDCYKIFENTLMFLLHKMHLGASHLGKIPRKAVAKPLLNNRIKYLETQLRQAVANECFEDAAQFRDKINEMKQLMGKMEN